MLPSRRWLYLTHRWLGIVLCLFFAMWFVSGVVMMYVGYPKLTPEEALAHSPPIVAETIRVTPAQAARLSGVTAIKEIRLATNVGGIAAYLVTPDAGPASGKRRRSAAAAVVVNATTGEIVPRADAAAATLAAQRYFAQEGSVAPVTYLGSIGEDAYTHSRALDGHRPLHLVAGGESGATWLYLSATTGEVVRDATATERLWNFAGAWIHWLYPFRDTVFEPYWHDIVVWTSLVGTLLGLVGLWIGILRWRLSRPYRSGSRSPYRFGFMYWHHVAGLLCGAFVVTWVFSGLMSMNPWTVLDSTAPKPDHAAYAQGHLDGAALTTPLAPLLANQNLRELVWTWSAGKAVLLAKTGHGPARVLDANQGAPLDFTADELKAAAARLIPGASIRGIDVLTAYDLYYYDRAPHTMSGHLEKPLPIWRVIYDDPWSTWAHIDPRIGQIIGTLDDAGRTRRWLFAFLHSFDWRPLLDHRPLWDILLIALSLGGATISTSGIVIGWRRLKHH